MPFAARVCTCVDNFAWWIKRSSVKGVNTSTHKPCRPTPAVAMSAPWLATKTIQPVDAPLPWLGAKALICRIMRPLVKGCSQRVAVAHPETLGVGSPKRVRHSGSAAPRAPCGLVQLHPGFGPGRSGRFFLHRRFSALISDLTPRRGPDFTGGRGRGRSFNAWHGAAFKRVELLM